MMLLLAFFLTEAWSVEVLNLKRQIELEVEAAHAANIERLYISPQDCQTPLRQNTRIRVLRANVIQLGQVSGLTHCPELTDNNTQSASHQKWQEARKLSGETGPRLDNRKIFALKAGPNPMEGIVRPEPIVQKKTEPSPTPRFAPPGGGKPCEVLVLSGEVPGISNKVPMRESCVELCQSFKARAQSVRCYFGDENITAP
jgi:hypothetical protein